MRASFLLCLAFCLSVSAIWQITEYTEYYFDYEEYDYECTHDLGYLEIVEVGTCTPTDDCYTSSPWVYTRSCSYVFPAINTYFDDDDNYHLIVEYDTQCDTDPVGYYFFADDCLNYYYEYYSSTTEYAMWFECDPSNADIIMYYTSDGTTTCDEGYYYYSNLYGPYIYTSYKLGDCFGYSSSYAQVICDATTSLPGWQVIKYTATESDSYSDDGDCSEDDIYVDYYYTEYCQPLGCVEGVDFYENWSCEEDEPEPTDFFETNPQLLVRFNNNAYDCFGEAYVYTVLNPGCAEGDEYYWYFDVDRDEGDVDLYYSTSSTCATYYSYFSGRDFYISSSEEIHEGCVYNDETYTLIVDGYTVTSAYQIVEYRAGSFTNSTIINVDMWFTDACIEQTVVQDFSEYDYLTEVWYCVDDEPNPFDFIEDGYLLSYYAAGDNTCEGDAVEYQIYDTGCTPDDGGTYFWAYECTQSATTSYFYLRRCTNENCTSGCYTAETISNPYIGEDYCNYNYKSGGSTSYYLELHCSPPNPAYQVIEYYAGASEDSLVMVDIFYDDYCQEGTTTSLLREVWTCSETETSPDSYFDGDGLVLSYYDEDECTGDAVGFTVAAPGCVEGDGGKSYFASCDTELEYGSLVMYKCDDAIYDTCRGECTATPYQFADYSDYADGCYHGVELTCWEGAPGYQVVYYYADTEPDSEDYSDLVYYTVEYKDLCYELGDIGYNYAGLYMFQSWSCEDLEDGETEFDYWEIWEDAYVLKYYTADYYADSDCTEFEMALVHNPGCVSTEIASAKAECSFSPTDGAELERYYYLGPECVNGTVVDSDTIIDSYYDGDVDYCYVNYAYDYYFGYYYYAFKLMCIPPNLAKRVELYYDDPDEEPLEAYAEWDEFCAEHDIEYYSDVYIAQKCGSGDEGEVVWTDYFDAEPITMDFYDSNDCNDTDYLYTTALNVGCVSIPASEDSEAYSVWAYCDPNNGEAWQYKCDYDNHAEWVDCIDYPNEPTYGGDCAYSHQYPYTPTEGDTCFRDWYGYDEYYTIDCGDIVTTSVYWVQSSSTSEAGCTEDPELESLGTFTRFCGAEEECTLEGDYYVNDTCIEQDEIAGYLIGGVIGYTYNADESPNCDDDNYKEGYIFIYNGCYLDEDSSKYVIAECDHAEADYNGLITFGLECDSCDIETASCATKYTGEDGDCEDGIKFVCGSSAASVAGLFVAILALLAFAL